MCEKTKPSRAIPCRDKELHIPPDSRALRGDAEGWSTTGCQNAHTELSGFNEELCHQFIEGNEVGK